jgi:hypothetical protein
MTALDDEIATALLDAVLGAVDDAVIQHSRDGAIVSCNRATERLFGVSADEVAGSSFTRFLAGEDHDAWQSFVDRALFGERLTTTTLRMRGAGGLGLHAMAEIVPIRSDDGSVTGICLVVRDLTERVLAQETLAASEHWVRRSEALAGSGSFVVAKDGSAQWSAGMYRLLDLSPVETPPSRDGYLSLVEADDRTTVEALIDAALQDGTPGEVDHRVVVEGRGLWMFLAVEPLRDDAGALVGARGICLDITARKQAEDLVRAALEREQRANDELRELDSLKDEFLATVSHELRTPLTAIVGFSALLGKKAPEFSELVDPIYRTGCEMARMVETLLDYSRLHAGAIALQLAPIDLAKKVSSCFERLEGPEHTLVNDVPDDLQVVADPDAMDRILGNLVGNAVRYSGIGSTVRVSATPEDGSILISVSDNGAGIPEHYQERLFERFYRVPGQTKERGTGIGLAIVAEYVARQHGTVWCESEVGKGTTFLVRLPDQRDVAE